MYAKEFASSTENGRLNRYLEQQSTAHRVCNVGEESTCELCNNHACTFQSEIQFRQSPDVIVMMGGKQDSVIFPRIPECL